MDPAIVCCMSSPGLKSHLVKYLNSARRSSPTEGTLGSIQLIFQVRFLITYGGSDPANKAPQDCPDPSTFIRPQKCLSLVQLTISLSRSDTVKCESLLLQNLPLEILLMILEFLSPSDLIRFFCINKWALSYASLFCRLNPLHFYRCNLNIASSGEDKRILMLALSTWSRISELDTRWQVVRKAADLAKLLPFVDQNIPSQTLDPRAPLQLANHRLGLHEDFLDIPLDAKSIEVCSIQLEGNRYICGIGFNIGRSKSFCGHKTKNIHIINIDSIKTEMIGIAVDALGVRNIKYGTLWLFDDSGSICCWQGPSVGRGHRKIRIIRDVSRVMACFVYSDYSQRLQALKFRYLSWNREVPLFEETILMKKKHPSLSDHEFIAEDYYVQQHPEQEKELVDKFGNIPVQAMWFDQDIQTIKLYTGDGFRGITGLSIQTASQVCFIGSCHTDPRTLTLYTHEVLSEIDVRTSRSFPLALTVSVVDLVAENTILIFQKFRTSYDRELSSEPYGLSNSEIQHTIKTLRPPAGSHMRGLYFRIEGSTIDSIGIIINNPIRNAALHSGHGYLS